MQTVVNLVSLMKDIRINIKIKSLRVSGVRIFTESIRKSTGTEERGRVCKWVQEYGNRYLDLSTFKDKDSCKGERNNRGENVHLVE